VKNLIVTDSQLSVIPVLIAAGGERASMRFLEFFAANIRNPHYPAGLLPGGRGISRLVCECRSAVDRRRPAGSCRDLDRSVDARARGAKRQAAACRVTASVRLVGQWPGRADQSGTYGARAPARRHVWADAGARSRRSARAASTASISAHMPVCAIADGLFPSLVSAPRSAWRSRMCTRKTAVFGCG
jgi:hypothetical protein